MPLRTPPLRGAHDDRGASFTDFGGWEMPVEFDSIKTEHVAVRESAGIFDVSHMGEITVSGPDATALMQRLVTNDVTALDVGDSQYAMITDEDGVVLDDTVVYRLADESDATAEDDGESYLFVPNAGHDEEAYDRWTGYRDERGLDATVENRTEEYGMFAVQGPEAESLVTAAASDEVADLSRFEARWAAVDGVDCWVARTGYTGEDGFELIVPWDETETVWAAFDCQPCGLGARDTLRIEAGFLLSGQDFDPEENPRNPYEAGVGFTVKLDTEFVGRDALARAKEDGVDETFVGFRLTERGVPRHGYDITNADGDRIGTVTSGTMSPTLDEPIGLGYVPVEYDDPGTDVNVVVRDRPKRAEITTTPFIDQ
ncbi:glycine cleavage system aminomethyltransferase GcvT [Halostella sp. JP-L12]|uniref:glycine cleavage system aminomethyltransferase GcvT n=1 Tax=Halostella TaxID=1843185 RepID=UPI000EF803A6|nr:MULTISPECIES: glycine cleavage system aminomethyltransferase GcvT [Halostella]NHN48382.1 glycine cleavage system aminomethyltransferase GcvT [Halostella sp. JP-L12]